MQISSANSISNKVNCHRCRNKWQKIASYDVLSKNIDYIKLVNQIDWFQKLIFLVSTAVFLLLHLFRKWTPHSLNFLR